MPKGAYPSGSVGSTKANAVAEAVCLVKCASNTSTLLPCKSVAYKKLPAPLFAIASPLYTAPSTAVKAVMACVRSTPGDQPAIMPPSPAKMKCDAPEAAELTTKSFEALKTIPVGLNAAPAALGAKLTTSGPAAGWALPLPSYWVAVAVRLLVTHIAVVGPEAMPHGLTRCASVVRAAVPAVSATRFVTVKAVGAVTFRVADFARLAAFAPLQVSVKLSAPATVGVCTLVPDAA